MTRIFPQTKRKRRKEAAESNIMYSVNHNSNEHQKWMAVKANSIKFERRLKETFRYRHVSIRLFNIISGQLSANM